MSREWIRGIVLETGLREAGDFRAVLRVADARGGDAGGFHEEARRIVSVSVTGPDGRIDEGTVRNAVARALTEAASDPGELAVPFPLVAEEALDLTAQVKIAVQEVIKASRRSEGGLRRVGFPAAEAETARRVEATACGYVRHLRDDLGWGPYVTVDAVIELPEGIVVVERSNPPFGWALPGGFVDCGESLDEAVRREAMEETGLELEDLRQMRTYSDPRRDPRFHTVSTVFIARGRGRPRAGDDARALQVVPYTELLHREYAFDHRRVLEDYLARRT